MNKPIIIGQAPARGNDRLLPFAGRSGARLAKLAGVGDTGDVLPKYFQLMNLLNAYPGKQGKGDAFSMKEARENARGLQTMFMNPGLLESRKILFMGKKVRRAMGVNGDWGYLEWFDYGHHRAAIFPHPSGVNRWWNSYTNTAQAEVFLKRLLFGPEVIIDGR